MNEIPPLFESLWFRLICGILIGASLGSFAGVIVDRLPKKLSITHPPSSCPSCQRRLGVLDLIPILSFLLAKGRCRYCKAPIGTTYFLIEVLTSVALGIATVFVGFRAWLVVYYLFMFWAIVFIFLKYSKKE